jgi:hypothetical protein
VGRGSIEPGDLAVALQERERGDRRRIGEILASLGFCRPEDVNAAQQIRESRVQHRSKELVRVGVDLLDHAPLQTISQRMNPIVTEVQQQVTKTRMQPIGNVWNRFPRTVRDLALSCGKPSPRLLKSKSATTNEMTRSRRRQRLRRYHQQYLWSRFRRSEDVHQRAGIAESRQ